MSQPLLHFAQIGTPVQGVGGGGGPQGVGAEAGEIHSSGLRIFTQHPMVNRPVGERPVGVPPPRRFFQGPQQRPVRILAVAGGLQVMVDALQGQRVGRHVPDLAVSLRGDRSELAADGTLGQAAIEMQ
jgi:hypothetical protein